MKFENILLSLFFFIYIIEAIIQIFLLNRFIKKHVEKYWYEFLGITIIIFLFDILTYTIFAYFAICVPLKCIRVYNYKITLIIPRISRCIG